MDHVTMRLVNNSSTNYVHSAIIAVPCTVQIAAGWVMLWLAVICELHALLNFAGKDKFEIREGLILSM